VRLKVAADVAKQLLRRGRHVVGVDREVHLVLERRRHLHVAHTQRQHRDALLLDLAGHREADLFAAPVAADARLTHQRD